MPFAGKDFFELRVQSDSPFCRTDEETAVAGQFYYPEANLVNSNAHTEACPADDAGCENDSYTYTITRDFDGNSSTKESLYVKVSGPYCCFDSEYEGMTVELFLRDVNGNEKLLWQNDWTTFAQSCWGKYGENSEDVMVQFHDKRYITFPASMGTRSLDFIKVYIRDVETTGHPKDRCQDVYLSMKNGVSVLLLNNCVARGSD